MYYTQEYFAKELKFMNTPDRKILETTYLIMKLLICVMCVHIVCLNNGGCIYYLTPKFYHINLYYKKKYDICNRLEIPRLNIQEKNIIKS